MVFDKGNRLVKININLKILFAVMLLSFLLNFVWEMWQMTWFTFEGQGDLLDMNWICTKASFGDSVISLIAYSFAGLCAHSVRWYLQSRISIRLVYLGIGLGITVILEWLNTDLLNNWQYVDSMPTAPGLGTGLLPLLQWLIVPLLLLWLLKFLSHATFSGSE
jgi:hypothetical protein